MTVDIEKLKALALAMPPGPLTMHRGEICYRSDENDQSYGMRCPVNLEAVLNFITVANPAAVLELIAEVERLSAELATRCRAKGGDTIGTLDRWTGHEIMNDPSLDCVEFVKLEDARRAAPAAGTVEKDATRYRFLRDEMAFDKVASRPVMMQLRAPIYAPHHNVHTDWPAGRFEPSVDRAVDDAIDAAIEAHSKAGKDATQVNDKQKVE